MNKAAPCILTLGEPAGIGPDLVIAFAQTQRTFPWFVIADPAVLQQRAHCLQQTIQLYSYEELNQRIAQPGDIFFYPLSVAEDVIPGQLNPANVAFVLDSLRIATTFCLEHRASAMMTGPVQKSLILQTGVAFRGQTEFIRDCCGVANTVMMLLTDKMKVALATTHLALREVPAAITVEGLKETIIILNQDLKNKFGIKQPRIAVCDLNPHAGETGHLGDEEIKIIAPVIDDLQKQGFHLTGPHSADTVFTPAQLQNVDVVLAMYHDQGLPVLKYSGFGHGANVTLGLPIIRVSVDHGTALALAGTGNAALSSFLFAFEMAQLMAKSYHDQ